MWRYLIRLALFVMVAAFLFAASAHPTRSVGTDRQAVAGLRAAEALGRGRRSVARHSVALHSSTCGRRGASSAATSTGFSSTLKIRKPIYGLNLKDDRLGALDWPRRGNPYVASAFDADGTVALDWGVTAAPRRF